MSAASHVRSIAAPVLAQSVLIHQPAASRAYIAVPAGLFHDLVAVVEQITTPTPERDVFTLDLFAQEHQQ